MKYAYFLIVLLILGCKNPDLTYRIGGILNNLQSGESISLTDGKEDIKLSSNGTFTFSTIYKKNENYKINIVKNPDSQSCGMQNSFGVVARLSYDLSVNCYYYNSYYGHLGPIKLLASNRYNYLVSLSEDNAILVWDLYSGATVGGYGANPSVSSIAAGYGEFTIAIGDTTGSVNVYNWSTRTTIKSLSLGAKVTMLKYLDSDNIFITTSNKIGVYNVPNDATFNGAAADIVKADYYNNRAAIAGSNGAVRIWDKTSNNFYDVATVANTIDVKLNSDATTLYILSTANLDVWNIKDLNNRQKLQTVALTGQPGYLAVNEDNNVAVGFNDGKAAIYLKQSNAWQKSKDISAPKNSILGLEFLPDDLIIGSKDGTIYSLNSR